MNKRYVAVALTAALVLGKSRLHFQQITC